MKSGILIAVALLVIVDAITPRSVTIIHRHGARLPVGVTGNRTSCNLPYCTLTTQGKEQCRAIGRYVNETYFENWGLGREVLYNVSFIRSTATQIPRVTISGEAAVDGMWPGALPYVNFQNTDRDIMLSPWTSWPSWKIADTWTSTILQFSVDEITSTIGGQSVVEALDEAYPSLGCKTALTTKDSNSLMNCVLLANDACAYNYSIGYNVPAGDSAAQTLTEHWSKIKSLVGSFYGKMLDYQSGTERGKNQGSLGLPLAQHMMSSIKYESSLKRVHHYVAHDFTLLALYGALGINASQPNPLDSNLFLSVPVFAATLLIEEYETSDPTNPNLVAYLGHPDQAPPSSPTDPYTLKLKPLKLSCMGSKGTVSLTNTCPLQSLERYINSTGPEPGARGECYATREDLEKQGCLSPGPVAPGSRCHFYRDRCPAEPCALIEGAIADVRSNFSCAVPPEAPHYMATTLLALIVPPLVFGSLMGYYCVPKLFAKKEK